MKRQLNKVIALALLIVFLTTSLIFSIPNEVYAQDSRSTDYSFYASFAGYQYYLGDLYEFQARNSNHTMRITEGTDYIKVTYPNGDSGEIYYWRKTAGSSGWYSWRNDKLERELENTSISNKSPWWQLYHGQLVDNGVRPDCVGYSSGSNLDQNNATYTLGGELNANNLIPNSIYTLTVESGTVGNYSTGVLFTESLTTEVEGYNRWRFENNPFVRIKTKPRDGSLYNYYTYCMIIYTQPARTILSASDIKDTKATIKWNPNGNPSETNYVLQRRIPGQAWVNRYTGYLNTFTDTNLNTETTYQYRVITKHISGNNSRDLASWQNNKEYIEVTTTPDPAVAFAQSASLAAKAAEEAASSAGDKAQKASESAGVAASKADAAYITALDTKDNTQLIDDKDNNNLKSVAQLAKEARDKVVSLETKIDNMPIIQRVYTTNGATASTTWQSPPIEVSASGATHFQIAYRDSNGNNNWGSPININSSGIASLSDGVNVIKVRAYNNNVPLVDRNYAYREIIIFRIQ